MTSRIFITCLLAGVVFVASPRAAHAQVLDYWTFSTSANNQTGPITATSVASGTTASTLAVTGMPQQGNGTNGTLTDSYYDNGTSTYALLWGDPNVGTATPTSVASAEANNQYVSFSVTPNAGTTLSLTALTFYASSGSYNGSLQVQDEIGTAGFNNLGSVVNISNGSVNGVTQLVTDSLSITADTSAVTFRFYLANSGQYFVDSLGSESSGAPAAGVSGAGLILDGTDASALPEPSTWSMFSGVIAFMAFLVYRRRKQQA